MTSFRAYEEDKVGMRLDAQPSLPLTRRLSPQDWDFNRVSDVLRPFIMFEHQGNGTYEVVVKDGWKGKVR